MSQNYFIKERSVIAFIARKFLQSKSVAVVIKNTIYLSGVNKELFLNDSKWLKHELCHIDQFRRYGFFQFMFLYAWETVKCGYYFNRFEVEARMAEQKTA